MESRRVRQQNYAQNDAKNSSIIGHITVYTYGKLFSPAFNNREKRDRNTMGSKVIDRPGLISKIHHLLEIHRARRERNIIQGTTCRIHTHKALMKAIRLCYEQKICDSKLYPVGDLFLELFLCTGNSCAIFSILLGGHMTSHLMNTDVNILYPNQVMKDNITAFEYYLHHISNVSGGKGNTLFDFVNQEIDQYSGILPLSAAVQKRDPSVVLVLLRYGADPFLSSVDSSYDDKMQNPTEQLIDDLNGLFLFKNTGFSEETRAKLETEEAKVWECLSYFRRAVPGIPLTSTTHIITTIDEGDTNCEQYIDNRFLVKQMYGIHPGIVQTIDINFFKATVSLKHLSRCAIRGQLKRNRSNITSVPKGISMLPLPSQLKSYLDLQID